MKHLHYTINTTHQNGSACSAQLFFNDTHVGDFYVDSVSLDPAKTYALRLDVDALLVQELAGVELEDVHPVDIETLVEDDLRAGKIRRSN